MDAQSAIFGQKDADEYFDRNGCVRGFIADYILSRFPRKTLATLNIAEFGIGGGQNLMLLSNYAQTMHGYDISTKAIECYKNFFRGRPDSERFYGAVVNLCEPFSTPHNYDLVMYGFFAYLVSESELEATRSNLLKALKPDGYVFIHDFLTRSNQTHPDTRNSTLKIYKRNLEFWLKHMSEFDLIDFRLFDDAKVQSDKERNEFQTIDSEIPFDDAEWNFGALFRRRL